jgi:uncharacterized protein (DUF1697 family)
MAGLKAMYEALQCKDVVTYIQSGNVIFKRADDISQSDLVENIQNAIVEKYKFEVPVIIRTKARIERIIAENPFLQQSDVDPEKLHVTFLSNLPGEEKIKKIETSNFLPDQFKITGEEVYLYCPSGYGNTKLSNTFFENKLKVTATTRNWRTINKLLELCKA